MRGHFRRVNPIVDGETAIEVSGPIEWEGDEEGAVIHVTVTQQGAKAQGTSAFTRPGEIEWFATVKVEKGSFYPGPASVQAKATVTLTNGATELKSWTDQVDLFGA